ncbi:RNA polymerase sigma factor [Pantoea sp. Ap-967]|uniref:RNA polymerase sigma factor n=1 Tax=Pantoea sp. Ap-967 TaxID=2608362 RepID=UPI001422DF5D|nr:RNA polymerase sigma factor [Pantoea sp. Ap-967]NIE76183.1 RNA polymerase sigma factor [Pantoea sp. Ap-967]
MSNPPHNKALLDALALHYDDLVSYIRLRFRDRHFARDLVHDVYLQILDKPPRERVSLPLAFLRKVTFNRAIDRVRAESLRAAHLAAASSDEPALDSWDGAQALDFEQQLLALLAIIEALPARQRQVFLLHRIHGMAQREIASELEISSNMVTQHFNRAMRAIVSRWEPARRLREEGRG